MGRYIAKNYYDQDNDSSKSTKGGERDMLFEFLCYSLAHFLFCQLRLFPVTAGAESREFGKMMFGVKAQIPGKVIFPLTQSFVGKFLNGSTVLADHEAMAAFYSIQAALHKSTAG